MELEKVTSTGKPKPNRWYDDACGTALALELVGERWSLLIVRELMFGPRRFSELRAGLPGISANVLTQRLAGMEAVGILLRRRLPSPAVQVYELTPWGYESERAIQLLGRWAVRSPLHDPTLPLSPASLMMSFRTMYTGGLDGRRIGFALGADRFVAEPTADDFAVVRADPDGCDLVWTGEARAVAAVVYGGMPLAGAERELGLGTCGNRALADRFVSCFPLPAKLASS